MSAHSRFSSSKNRELRQTRRGRQDGFALLEALVAMLVFALGILGIIGLQGNMTREQGVVKMRADAAFLASEIIGSMWVDIANIARYKATSGDQSCNGYTRCNDWLNKVSATLPSAAPEITVAPATGDVTVTITWTMPGGDSHKFTTATTIVAAKAG